MKSNNKILIYNCFSAVVMLFFAVQTMCAQNIQPAPNKSMSKSLSGNVIQTLDYQDVFPSQIATPQNSQISVRLAPEAQPQLTPAERAQAMTTDERAVVIQQLNEKLAQATPGSAEEQKLLNMIAYLEGLN